MNNRLSKNFTVMCIFIDDFDKLGLQMLKGKQITNGSGHYNLQGKVNPQANTSYR